MDLEEIVSAICKDFSRDDYCRFDLNLPKKIIGKGRKMEMYVAPHEAKPWVNGDCKIPIEFLEGAMIEKIIDDRVIISFILPIEYLLPFFHSLKEKVDIENDLELVQIDCGTVDSKTPTEAT